MAAAPAVRPIPRIYQCRFACVPPFRLLFVMCVRDARGPPDRTPALARLANDGLADLCRRYPDRFPTFVASLPMNNIEAAIQEADRAIGGLGARGVQVFTN